MASDRATDGSWQISRGPDERALLLEFAGPTSTEQFREFLVALTERLPERGAKLTFDLTRLGGYNPATKAPIKAWLLAHKAAIDDLTVVVPKSSLMLKMASAAISLAVRIKFVIREAPSDAEASPRGVVL